MTYRDGKEHSGPIPPWRCPRCGDKRRWDTDGNGVAVEVCRRCGWRGEPLATRNPAGETNHG